MSKQSRPKIGSSFLKRYNHDTQFQIDFSWWEQSELDLQAYLSSRLNIDSEFSLDPSTEQVDMVDPRTGEVRQVDGFQYVLQSYFRQLPDDFIKRAALVDAVFCVLLGNANHPMSALELGERVQRSAETIVQTLTGGVIYQGIRPVAE